MALPSTIWAIETDHFGNAYVFMNRTAIDVIDTRTGRIVHTLNTDDDIYSLSAGPSGEIAVAGNGKVTVYRKRLSSVARIIPVAGTTSSAAYDPNGDLYVISGGRGTLSRYTAQAIRGR